VSWVKRKIEINDKLMLYTPPFLRRVIILYQSFGTIMKFSATKFPANKDIKRGERESLPIHPVRRTGDLPHYQRGCPLPKEITSVSRYFVRLKRLFRFPALSDYLREGSGCKLGLLQDTFVSSRWFKGSEGEVKRVGGLERRLEWGYIFLISFCARARERERERHSNARIRSSSIRVDGRI